MIKPHMFCLRLYGDLCVVSILNNSYCHYHHTVTHNAYIKMGTDYHDSFTKSFYSKLINFHRRLLKYEEVGTVRN